MKIAVVGLGQMGIGIAQTFAAKGHNVLAVDDSVEAAAQAIQKLKAQIDKLVSKGKLSETEASKILTLVRPCSLEEIAGSELVIEAVPEKLELKARVLTSIEKVVEKNTIIASNTSSISITRLGSFLSNPTRFVGMHFMNPVPIMKLIEVIYGLKTNESVLASIVNLCSELGKTPVQSKDFPGFIVNRVLMPMINEAFFVLQEGIASAADIDQAMVLGTNQPMGPLTLADFIGLDTCLSILNVLHHDLGDTKYRPSPLLKQYVDAGLLGRKSKQGVFVY